MAYENDIVDVNIIRCSVKMQIYIKSNFLNAKNNRFQIKNQKYQKN